MNDPNIDSIPANAPKTIVDIIKPLNKLTNKRRPILNGVETSLIKFVGNKIGNNHHTGPPTKDFSLFFIPRNFTSAIFIATKVIIVKAKATDRLAKGGDIPNNDIVFAKAKNIITVKKYGAKNLNLLPDI